MTDRLIVTFEDTGDCDLWYGRASCSGIPEVFVDVFNGDADQAECSIEEAAAILRWAAAQRLGRHPLVVRSA